MTAPAARGSTALVRPSVTPIRLSVVIAVLAGMAAAVGLLWSGGSAPEQVTTVHGERVTLFGEGLYRYDSLFRGAGNRGADLATFAVAIPALIAARRLYRSASLAGALALTGVLGWFLYYYASLALGSAYNELFLVYVVLTSSALFAMASVMRSLDLSPLDETTLQRLPVRRMTVLLLVSAALTAFVWLEPVVTAAVAGVPPAMLLNSTTLVTEVVDLALIAPAAVLAALLLRQGRREGLMLGVPLLVLLWVLAPAIVLQTVLQLQSGWPLTPPQVAGPVVGFVVLGAAATAVLVPALRSLHDATAGSDLEAASHPFEAPASRSG